MYLFRILLILFFIALLLLPFLIGLGWSLLLLAKCEVPISVVRVALCHLLTIVSEYVRFRVLGVRDGGMLGYV
jgi:hypothetical protein